jgi:predicted ATPase
VGKLFENSYIAGNPDCNDTGRLVVISGCSSGGKSSLLSEMHRRGYAVRPEPGRQIVREQMFIDGDALPWADSLKFIELCISRAAYFYNSVTADEGCVLFDRSIVDAATAFPRMNLPTPAWARNALDRYRYAPTVFLTPPWEALFETDAERRGSFETASAEYHALAASFPANGYRIEEIPRASIAERADFLEARLLALGFVTKAGTS